MPTIEDIHDRLWSNRDFEISHLWQRSIFLTTFIILCLSGYGITLMGLIDNYWKDPFVPQLNSKVIVLNILCYFISIIGFFSALFWIMMAKGSKAWYENYEGAIDAFYKDNKYVNREIQRIGGFKYSNMEHFNPLTPTTNLFSTNAGPYSVSRINIGIGQALFILWSFISLFHVILEIFLQVKYEICLCCNFMIIILFLVQILGALYINNKCFQSTYFSK